MTLLLSSISGFVGGCVAWFCSNFLGRPIVEPWNLRSEAHRFLYYYANINFDRPPNSRNADDAQKCFRSLAARVDALRTSTPRLMLRLAARRGYNLQSAVTGLTGLSNTLARGREDEATSFRVQAQRALRLPVHLKDQEWVDLKERLAGKPI
jgi:hypothetical protein